MNCDTENILKDINNRNNIKTKFVDNLDQVLFDNVALSIFSINIRSVKSHFYELTVLLSTIKNNFYIIILSEAWLSENNSFKLNGYTCFCTFTNLNKADGVCIFVNNKFKVFT